MTSTDKAKLRELAEKATPGPWQRSGVKLHFTPEWLRSKIESDPDIGEP